MLEAAAEAAGAGIERLWHYGAAGVSQLVWYRLSVIMF